MIKMNYEKRIEHVREEMINRDIGLMFLDYGADLWYLTGIRRKVPELTDSNAYGDYICGAYICKDKIILVAPRMGGNFFQNEIKDKSWINTVRIINESEKPKEVLKEVIKDFNVENKKIAFSNRAWMETGLMFQKIANTNCFSLASEIIDSMRMIKDKDEIMIMKEAGKITDKVYGKIVDFLEVGLSEYDVANKIEHEFRKHGVDYPSFITGVRFTSPEKPQIINNVRTTGRKLEEGDSVTFDFGVCYKGYCSDFGRTAFVGSAPEEFKKIHEIVMKSQKAAIDEMRSGKITAMELDKVARNIIENAGYGDFFTHRLGHGIGVTVHEPPFLYIPDDTLLQSGMTFTVEPSIRLPNSYGCRVEDVVMVTEDGGEPLTNYHKELTII